MTIICDFDYTLFNSGVLKEAQRLRAQNFGISQEQWGEIRSKLSYGGVGSDILVSNENYAQIATDLYDCDRESFRNGLEDLLMGECNSLFSDAVEFLDALGEHDMILLTFGDDGYQRQKIDFAQIESYFNEVIITQGEKGPILQRIVDDHHYNQPYFFVDDKPSNFAYIKQYGLPIVTILVQHCESGRLVDPDKNCDFVVSSLLDARDIIRKNS